ncbi:helix-turn-helix domain-containing protein [Streptococcus suis]|uniref:Cytoskeletal protein RodZ n=1 Tax=Streptococcus parasuis TaxID=1501662 RepID=A0ABV2EQC5_9STRE|nr:cytoskeleton protein RodZ [Streptococcus parasuis]MBY4972081.1 helix-turn-helix domain-containing protein [Streptococcus suis]NQM55263.1 helix-turn-helix domain-containing protein [Streptococcus suis]NQP32557.1 helix-turn-helix domain-containing protein [Streptococcus suis]NQP36699.1 helix-turn-helix domain-containing protein [Streptococcus suis]BCP60798.1 membrane protein [Streptococcus parasuis]
MRQKSIGEVLRSARESRGWNLIDVQRMTKIQAKYLQALEYNDFEYIPDSNYIESFLVTYADALELDSAVLLDAYKKNSLVIYYEEGEEEELSTELKRRYKLRKKNKKDSFLPLFYLLLAAGLMIIFVTFVIHSRMKQISLFSNQSTSYSVSRQVTNSTSSIASTSTSGNVIEESSSNSSSSTSSSTTSASEMIQVTGSGESISATVSKITYPIDITVTADNTTSWISLSDTTLSGGVTLTPDNPSATTKIEEGVSSATLVLGVVKGVTITIGGQKLDTSALTTQTGSITLYFEQ